MLFGDPKYTATVKDVEERGESKKRKGVVPLTVPDPQGQQLQDWPEAKSVKGPAAEDKKPEKVVKMKVGERKKMEKKVLCARATSPCWTSFPRRASSRT